MTPITRCLMVVSLTCAGAAFADEKNPVESDYYPITTFELPEGESLEAGALLLREDGTLAVCTRRGEVWIVRDPLARAVKAEQFSRFAHGLHEPLGLAERDGWLYVTQRCDVSRLKDQNGDGRADLYEVVSDGWGITGDYHEYAFGTRFDPEGNIWVALCLTGSFSSEAKYRGWCVRISGDGKFVPTASGIRSPGGIGFAADGAVFYTDNQGPWNGTCTLKLLAPGKFVGHPGGNRWYDLCKDVMGPRPREPESGSRFITEAGKIPELEPPAILFPYKKMGQSASGVIADTSGGKFGPFTGQLFVGDQSHSTLMRCFLEKVDGHYQGACFPFREGFASGTLCMEFAPTGDMFVGGTSRGWASRGNKPFALERMRWTGVVPFEIQEMRARPDGFELEFTEPVDPRTASDVESYSMTTYTYIYQATYGSPEVDGTTPTIKRAEVSDNRRRVRLYIEGLQPGHVHELFSPGVRSATGRQLLHREAYYTLNFLPKDE